MTTSNMKLSASNVWNLIFDNFLMFDICFLIFTPERGQ